MQAIEITIADLEAVAAEYNLDAAAFAAYMEYENMDLDEAVEAFQDHYAGTFGSLAEWAEQYMDDSGMLAELPENLRFYFDFALFGRDADINGDIWTIDIGCEIAVFWR